jgi:hypothetical protein
MGVSYAVTGLLAGEKLHESMEEGQCSAQRGAWPSTN